MKLSIVQMAVNETDFSQNHDMAMQMIESVPATDLLILPELFASGYNQQAITECSNKSSDLLKDISLAAQKMHSAILAGSLAIKDGNETYNRSCFFTPNGLLASKYDKTHLFKLLNEDHFFSAGNKLFIIDYAGWRIGVLICYDLRFPELARLLALQGCNLLIIPAAWPAKRISVFKQLAIARAIENQLWVVAVNRASFSADKITYGGNSIVVAPDGEIIAEAGILPQIMSVEINLAAVEEYRQTIPCFSDRRDDLYKLELNYPGDIL